MPTDFPKKGDDKKVSLRNSNFPQFDYDYALDIRENHSDVWKKGGNKRGNGAFENWGACRGKSADDLTDAMKDWIREREAWMARHEKNKRIAGVVAVMKWGGVVEKGESYMKDLIDENKKEKAGIPDREGRAGGSQDVPRNNEKLLHGGSAKKTHGNNAGGETVKTWFEVKSESASDEAEIFIYDVIGGLDVDAKSFIEQVKAIAANKIKLRINSPGGSVFDAIAIYNYMQSSEKTFNVLVDGIAASAASFIAMAGDTLTMPANTFLMIHNAWMSVYGNPEELRKAADDLDKFNDSIVMSYVDKTGMEESEIRKLMDDESWISGEEAQEMGFADEVIGAVEIAASYDKSKLDMPENVKCVIQAAKQKKEKKMDKDIVKSFIDAFGKELSADYLADGLSMEEATAKYSQHLAERVAELEADQETVKAESASALEAKDKEIADLKAEVETLKSRLADSGGTFDKDDDEPKLSAEEEKHLREYCKKTGANFTVLKAQKLAKK